MEDIVHVHLAYDNNISQCKLESIFSFTCYFSSCQGHPFITASADGVYPG